MTIKLEKTCEACPEQYDAFDGERLVGYLRLRWSQFSVVCPDVGGEEVYASPIGDSGWEGEFEDEAQRMVHLHLAKAAIEDWLKRNA